jgi:putative MATE family efflux protein
MSEGEAGGTASRKGEGRPARVRPRLTEGVILRHLLRFIVPMSLGLSAMMLNGLIDAFWLGRLSTDALAAVSFVFPIIFAVMSVSIGLSAGAVAAISRVAASGDSERVRRLAADAMLLGALLVVCVSIAGVLASRLIFATMGAEGAILDNAATFGRIWFVGNICVVVPALGNAMLRAVGEAVLPSLLMTLAAVVNMAIDPILIFGLGPAPRLEVAGAAIATVLANAVAAVAVIWVVVFRERIIAFSLPEREVMLRHWREILHVGLPAMGSNMLNPLALAFVVASLARFGPAVVAGYGAAARVETFSVIPLLALSAAMGPMTGQNNAAGRIDRVRESFRSAFRICAAWAVGVAVILALAAPLLATAFSTNPETQAAMRSYLWITPISVWGYGFVIAAAAGFNGISKPAPGLAMTFGRSVVLLASFAWIGGTLFGPLGAFAGVAAANVVAGLAASGWTLLRAFPRVPAESGAEPVLDAGPGDR